MAGIIVSGVAAALIYLITSPMAFYKRPFSEFSRPKVHLSVLIALFFLLKAWGYKLSTYALLYSSHDVLYGAGYTDINARLFAYKTLLIIALVCSLAIVLNLFVRKLKWVAISVTLLIAASLLLGVFYPNMVQKFQVLPNQFAMEEPYIDYNINFTQKHMV